MGVWRAPAATTGPKGQSRSPGRTEQVEMEAMVVRSIWIVEGTFFGCETETNSFFQVELDRAAKPTRSRG